MILVPVVLASLLSLLAGVENPEIATATKAYKEGRIPRALKALDNAEHTLGITEDDLVKVYFLKGTCLIALGKRPEAAESFDALLRLRPLHEPSEMEFPPPVRAAFTDHRKKWQEKHGVQLEAPVVDGRVLTSAMGGNTSLVFGGVMFLRLPGDVTYQEVELALGEGSPTLKADITSGDIWERAKTLGALEVVLEARNDKGTPVARGGDARIPWRVVVTPEAAGKALESLAPPPPPPPPPAPVAAAAPPPAETGGGPSMGLLVGAVGLGAVAALGVVVLLGAVAVAGLGLAAFGYGYQQLVTPGIDARPADKATWSNAYLGGQAAAAVGVMLGAGALVLAVLAGGGAVGSGVMAFLR